MIDSQRLIYVPRPARVAALALLTLSLTVALVAVATFVALEDPAQPRFSDWILVGMSLAQLSLSGLAIALILFYSEREANAGALQDKAGYVLTQQIPEVLRKVTPSFELRHRQTRVEMTGQSDIFGAAYRLQAEEHVLRVWIGLNVSRLFVIFWIDEAGGAHGPAPTAAALQEVFRFTFGGAEDVGYRTRYEAARAGERQIVSIWSTVDCGSNLLSEPSKRLFWIQDIAMMIESFWRTSIRNGLQTADVEPGPL